MAIETLEDIVEEVANQLGIYGVHGEEEECRRSPTCRVCFTSSIKLRILAAVEIERKLSGAFCGEALEASRPIIAIGPNPDERK